MQRVELVEHAALTIANRVLRVRFHDYVPSPAAPKCSRWLITHTQHCKNLFPNVIIFFSIL